MDESKHNGNNLERKAVKTPTDIAHLMDDDEYALFAIRRHPIGIVFIYLLALAIFLTLSAIAYMAIPSLLETISEQTNRLLLGLMIIAVAIMVFILLIATYIYRLSMLVVTNKSLIQIVQNGLFSRKVGRFTMSDVENVTADQHGILATIFIYGTLTVETAGTKDNFSFSYCPDPNHYAHLIIDETNAAEQDSG